MNENPCAGKWRLPENTVAYADSSARFYISGVHAKYAVLNFKELADINLTVRSG